MISIKNYGAVDTLSYTYLLLKLLKRCPMLDVHIIIIDGCYI